MSTPEGTLPARASPRFTIAVCGGRLGCLRETSMPAVPGSASCLNAGPTRKNAATPSDEISRSEPAAAPIVSDVPTIGNSSPGTDRPPGVEDVLSCGKAAHSCASPMSPQVPPKTVPA